MQEMLSKTSGRFQVRKQAIVLEPILAQAPRIQRCSPRGQANPIIPVMADQRDAPCVDIPSTAGQEATPAERPSVASILDRMDREARRGVCRTGRYRCKYIDWGDGPPLVFIPGLGTDATSFALVMARLANDFRCISYDLPAGKGDGALMSRYTHGDLVADLIALLDHLDVQQGQVLGYSFGSTIALEALRTHPDRLQKGVLLSGFARRPLAPAEHLLVLLCRHWHAPLEKLPFHRALYIHGNYRPFRRQAADVWDYFIHCSEAPPIAAVAYRALLMHPLDLRPRLTEIKQPVLLITGDEDPLVTRQCEDELQRGLPGIGQVELANCGHFALFTHPAEVAELLCRFLKPPCPAEECENAGTCANEGTCQRQSEQGTSCHDHQAPCERGALKDPIHKSLNSCG